MYLADQVMQLAYDPGIKPNEGGPPGLSVLKQVMGSINLFGLIAVVGALAVSAGVWAWGHHSGGHQAEAEQGRGDRALLLEEVLGGLEHGTRSVRHHLVSEAGRLEDGLHGWLVDGGEGTAGVVVTRHPPVSAELREQQTQHVVDQVPQPHHGPRSVDVVPRLVLKIQDSPVPSATRLFDRPCTWARGGAPPHRARGASVVDSCRRRA